MKTLIFSTIFAASNCAATSMPPGRQATIDKIQTAAVEATIMAGGVSMSLYQLVFVVGQITIGVPALMLLLVTLVGVPWVTKWSLRSLGKLTDGLDKVDFEAPGRCSKRNRTAQKAVAGRQGDQSRPQSARRRIREDRALFR